MHMTIDVLNEIIFLINKPMNTYTDLDNQKCILFEWEILFNWVIIGERYAKSIISILESEEEDTRSIADIENEVGMY